MVDIDESIAAYRECHKPYLFEPLIEALIAERTRLLDQISAAEDRIQQLKDECQRQNSYILCQEHGMNDVKFEV